MTDWGFNDNNKENEDSCIRNPRFLLFNVLESAHIYFSDSLLVEAVMHTAMVYSKVSE